MFSLPVGERQKESYPPLASLDSPGGGLKSLSLWESRSEKPERVCITLLVFNLPLALRHATNTILMGKSVSQQKKSQMVQRATIAMFVISTDCSLCQYLSRLLSLGNLTAQSLIAHLLREPHSSILAEVSTFPGPWFVSCNPSRKRVAFTIVLFDFGPSRM